MNIGNAIKEIRKVKGVTRKGLSEKAGVSVTALYNIENGLSWPSQETINKLCEALCCPVSYLLLFSVEEADIPMDKRDAFRVLLPLLKQFLLGKEDEK